MTAPRRSAADVLAVLTLAALVVATWLPRLQGPIDLRWDAGVYYVLGTALADGRGYRLLNEPGEIEATQYPPLWPAIIAGHQLLAGTRDPTHVGRRLRMTFVALSVALVLAAYVLLRRYVSPPWALVGAAACGLHISTVFVSDIGFAELPFTLLTVLFFLVSGRGTGLWRDAASGLLAVAAYLLRSVGVALLVAWVADALVARDGRRALLRLGMALPVVAGWQLYVGGIERSASYAAPSYAYQRADYLFYNVSYARNVVLRDPERPELGKASAVDLARRLADNLVAAPARIGEAITVGPGYARGQIARLRLRGLGRLVLPALSLVGAIALVGLAGQLLRGDRLLPLHTALYVLAVCLTPWAAIARYWFPIAPFVIVGVACGVRELGRVLDAVASSGAVRWGRRTLVAGAALVLLTQLGTLEQFFRERHQPVAYRDRQGELVAYRLFYYRDTYRALDAGLDRLRDLATPADIVAASMPHWVHLRTGLKAVMPPFEPDPARALQLLESVPAGYLIVDGRTGSVTREFGLPAVRQAPERWRSVFAVPDAEVEIFQRVPSP